MKKLMIVVFMCMLMGSVLTELNADISKEMDALQIYTEEFPPLNLMQDGQLTGQATEVVQEILKRMDINKDITLLLWSDAYQKLVNEPNIVLFSTSLISERKDLFKWVGPISSVENYFLYFKRLHAEFKNS